MGNLRDFATGTVVTPPSPATTGNTATLQTGEAARMPTVLPFYATAHPDNTFPTFFNSEKILVTAVNTSTDVITFTRARGEASAKSIAAGWRISNTLFADDIYNSTMQFDQVPTGIINGTNPTFTLPTPATDVVVYKNGVRMQEGVGNDYIFSNNNTITFQANAIPATGKVTYDAIIGSQLMIAGSNSLATDETPSGLVNGATTLYTTARPYTPGSLEYYNNGWKQKRGVHFTETNPALGQFTVSDAPITGDDIMVNYQFVASVSGNADTLDGYHANPTPTPGQLLPLNEFGQTGEWWEEVGRSSTVVAGAGGDNNILVTLSKPCKYITVIANGTLSVAPSYSWLRFNEITANTYHRSWVQTNTSGALAAASSTGTVATLGDFDWVFNVNATASVSAAARLTWSGSAGSQLRQHTFGGRLATNVTAITSVRIGCDNAALSGAELIVLGHN